MSDREAALRAVAERRVAEAMPPQQLELVDHLAEIGVAVPATVVERRKAGRPPGSKNRRHEESAQALMERLGDPLARQVAIATAPLEELAAALGCSRLEAAVEARLAAHVALPFLRRRMPQAVDITDHRQVHLTILTGGFGVVAPGVPADVEVVEYQAVTEGEGDAV